MSGLIWGGIGKGLSDAGETYGKFMMADIMDQRQAAREEAAVARQEKSIEAASERQSARDVALADRQAAAASAAQEKAEALERLRQKIAEEKLDATRERAKKDLVEVATRADAAEFKRDETQINTDTSRLASLSSQIKGKSPSTDAETFKNLIKENPQYREVYRQAGYIDGAGDPGKRALDRLDDESKAAIEIGADQNVINYYKDKRASVLKQIEIQNKQDQFESKLPIDQQNADSRSRTAKAAEVRAAKPSGQGRSSSGNNDVARERSDFTQRERTIRTHIGKAYGDEKTKLQKDLATLQEQRRQFEDRVKGNAAPAPKTPGPRKGVWNPTTGKVEWQ